MFFLNSRCHNLSTMDLASLIRLCQKEDRKAQEELVLRFAPFLFPVCRSYLRDSEEVKDVLQDVFVSIFKNIHQIDPDIDNFKGWIRKIAVNQSLQVLRRMGRKNELLTEDYAGVTPVQTPGVYSSLEHSDTFQLVMTLKYPYRQVFCLYAIDGFSHKEIAIKLDLKEGTVRSAYHRAKEKLKSMVLKKNELQTS